MTKKKPHPLKGRKLTPEQIAARIAARERNKKSVASEKTPLSERADEAAYYLNKAIAIMREEIRLGKKKDLTNIDVYVHLAKRTLEGTL